MKKKLLFLLLINSLYADAKPFELETFSYSMENDVDVNTDFGYTHGAKISLLFYSGETEKSFLSIPFTSTLNRNNFISFIYAQQMFTPYDLKETEIVKDDRPYAGYSYLEIGLHQSMETDLDSLTLQIGVIGPSSGMEDLQNFIHENIDTFNAIGWKHQLENQFIMQLNYMHKWRLVYSKFLGMDSVLAPYVGINLGNSLVKASTGALYRIGLNIPKDFGINSMDEGSFSSLPIKSKSIVNDSSKWSLFLNLSTGVNLVAHNIFLDDWYFVDRNYFNAYSAVGITARYKNFSIDYQHNYYTKDYKQRGQHKVYKGYGSLILTYNFE